MAERTSVDASRRPVPNRTPPSAAGPAGGPRSVSRASERALALQRAAGNRATTQVLARWSAHPDKDKKGVLMPDAMAAEFVRFNPPLSK
ncbi:MAG: hypothetical protein ABSH51_02230 [Solirubrobacteraceae bacterium]|jgi:hypothetical protein